jgi:hypothetical protein
MVAALQSAKAKAGVSANNGAPEADAFQFRAPRHGDLVVCPYCPRRSTRCDYCGGEGSLFASDLTYFEENQYG